MKTLYPEIAIGRHIEKTAPTFPKSCPACGACVVKAEKDSAFSARYACGGGYTRKPQIQTHTRKWWGGCNGGKETFRKVRTKADIEVDPRVEELWNEGDSSPDWWCALKSGWSWCPETHCIHENTIRDVCDVLNREVAPCDAGCPCQKEAAVAAKVGG